MAGYLLGCSMISPFGITKAFGREGRKWKEAEERGELLFLVLTYTVLKENKRTATIKWSHVFLILFLQHFCTLCKFFFWYLLKLKKTTKTTTTTKKSKKTQKKKPQKNQTKPKKQQQKSSLLLKNDFMKIAMLCRHIDINYFFYIKLSQVFTSDAEHSN